MFASLGAAGIGLVLAWSCRATAHHMGSWWLAELAIFGSLFAASAGALFLRRSPLARPPGCRMPSSSARARTGWPPRSRWRARAVRSACSRPRTRSAAARRSAELTLPGVRPRRLLGDPPAGRRLAVLPRRCRWRSTGSSGSSRRRRSRIRSTTAARPCSSARSRRPRRRSAPTPSAYRRLIAPLGPATPTRCRRLARAAPLPRHPLAWRASGCARLLLGDRARADSRSRGERARALFAGLAAHSMLPLERPPTRRVRPRARRCSATRSAGRSPRGGSQRDRRRARLVPALARRRDRDGPAGRVARRAAGARVVLLDVDARGSSLAIAGDAPAGPLPPAARPLPLRAGRVQARLGARRADPVARRGRARAPATVHLGGTLDEIAAAEARPSARRAPGAAVRPARPAEPLRPDARARRASTRPGRTATSRNGSTRRHDRARSRRRSSASPRASAT